MPGCQTFHIQVLLDINVVTISNTQHRLDYELDNCRDHHEYQHKNGLNVVTSMHFVNFTSFLLYP